MKLRDFAQGKIKRFFDGDGWQTLCSVVLLRSSYMISEQDIICARWEIIEYFCIWMDSSCMIVDGHCCTARPNKHVGPPYLIFDTFAELERDGTRRTTHPKEGNARGRGAGTDGIPSANIRGISVPTPWHILASQPTKTVWIAGLHFKIGGVHNRQYKPPHIKKALSI